MREHSPWTSFLGFLVILACIGLLLVSGVQMKKCIGTSMTGTGIYFCLALTCAIMAAVMTGILWPDILGRRISGLFLPDDETSIETYSEARKLKAQRRFREAIDAFVEGSQKASKDPTPLIEAAAIYTENLKEGSAAVELYRKVLDRTADPALWAFACNRAADILSEQNRREEAREFVGRLADRFPKTEQATRARERLTRMARG